MSRIPFVLSRQFADNLTESATGQTHYIYVRLIPMLIMIYIPYGGCVLAFKNNNQCIAFNYHSFRIIAVTVLTNHYALTTIFYFLRSGTTRIGRRLRRSTFSAVLPRKVYANTPLL